MSGSQSSPAYRWSLCAIAALPVLLSAAPPPKPPPAPTTRELAQQLRRLNERLARVEGLLGSPFGAELTAGTILERVDRLERSVRRLGRGQPPTATPRGGTADLTALRLRLQEALSRVEQSQRDMSRTLDDLRRELRDARRQAEAVRDLRRTVDRLRRDIESLERRVARLERP